MNVRQIPFENRYFVGSSSRDIDHIVDLAYQENPWNKPKPSCGCESSMIYGRICPHIKAVIAYAQSQKTTEQNV